VRSTSLTAFDTDDGSPASAWIEMASPIFSRTAMTVSEASTTSTAATMAPSCAKSSAATRPMPLAAPVISATLPSKRPIWFSSRVERSE